MNNHRLTIRLDDQDLERIQTLKDNQSCTPTTNATLKLALKKATQIDELIQGLTTAFHYTWTPDQKALEKLNKKYGFLQGRLFTE